MYSTYRRETVREETSVYPRQPLPAAPAGFPGYAQQGPNAAVVEERLVQVLSKYPAGVLGAHIPAIYREEYDEPLRLYGRKLKDILLGQRGGPL